MLSDQFVDISIPSQTASSNLSKLIYILLPIHKPLRRGCRKKLLPTNAVLKPSVYSKFSKFFVDLGLISD